MEIKNTATVYLGPSRPFNLSLMQNAILADEPEKVIPGIAPFLEKHKNFKKLFVPVASLAQARAQIKKAGMPLALVNEEIKEASDNFKKQAKK